MYIPKLRHRSQTHQRGFSIVELVMVMGILSIMMVVLTDVFASILNIQAEANTHSAVTADGRYIMARLSYDLNRASSVTTPATLGGTDPSLAIMIGGVTNTYALSGGTLQLTNGAGTSNLNSGESTISSVTFQRLGIAAKDSVQATFTVTSVAKSKQGQEAKTFTITVARR